MLTSSYTALASLEPLKASVESEMANIKKMKERVVTAQHFELAAKLREVEKAMQNLVSKIDDTIGV